MTNSDSTPGTPGTPDDQPTTPISPAASAAPAPAPEVPAPETPAPAPAARTKRRGRTALIAGGAVLGAAVLIGGGIAIGAAISDDDDDADDFAFVAGGGDDRATELVEGSQSQSNSSTSPDAAAGDGGTVGAASADELIAIADAASGVAEGAVVSIDANRDGSWDVQLIAADGTERDVRVAADGTAVLRETDADDNDAPSNVLDAQTLRTLVEAALGTADGRIIDIDADDDGRSPFDVTVLQADRQIVEITLDVDGSVLRTELDD